MLRLSRQDFLALTPEEFSEVLSSADRSRRHREQTAWEQTRMLAAFTLMPHSKKKVEPRRILPFPWDKEKGDTHSAAKPKEPKLTREEHLQRMKLIAERLQKKPPTEGNPSHDGSTHHNSC